MSEATAEQQITITRMFDAPRELVFRAWTDPDQVARWFGPAGMETPRDLVEIDLRVGGSYHLSMVQGGGGRAYPLRYEIVELVEPELLVLRSEPMPGMGLDHATITRVEFHEEDGGTRMTLTDGPYPKTRAGGAGEGWNGAFEKLATLLGSSS